MTVSDLIEALKTKPQNARVIVSGYEGGYCDPRPPEDRPIRLDVHAEHYYGPHDDAELGQADEVAVFIG